jgi:hypothetical protein
MVPKSTYRSQQQAEKTFLHLLQPVKRVLLRVVSVRGVRREKVFDHTSMKIKSVTSVAPGSESRCYDTAARTWRIQGAGRSFIVLDDERGLHRGRTDRCAAIEPAT